MKTQELMDDNLKPSYQNMLKVVDVKNTPSDHVPRCKSQKMTVIVKKDKR